MSEPDTACAADKQWPEIGDYGLIGDCRTAALVGRNGAIEWWCLPHFSGPAFFAALLDRDQGGHCSVRPNCTAQPSRQYLKESNVLQTRFQLSSATGNGELRLTDAMTIPQALEEPQLVAQRELLRQVEAVGADVPLDILYAPRPDYARASVRLHQYGKLGWACVFRDHLLLLHTDIPLALSEDGCSLHGRCVLPAGERRFLSITYVKNDIGVIMPLGQHAAHRIEATDRWWREWSSHCRYQGPYRDAVVRSVLTAKLLTYCLSGAMVAAPTASLPEDVGGERNWDYRYCWLRDASLTVDAFLDLGYQAEADAFMGWLLHATALTLPTLQVLYDVHGEARVPEFELNHLSGYRGSSPVRIGNGAWNQRQMDIYGSVILAATSYSMRGGPISRDGYRMLVKLGNKVCSEWREPDSGLWEIRGEPRHHTHSKVMCWAALDCLLGMAEQGSVQVPEERFRTERNAIAEAIEVNGFCASVNSYVATFSSGMADASLFLLPRLRYVAASDPRMLGTLGFLAARLSDGALVYRYRENFDELPGKEHPFGICSFWAVDALAQAGRLEEATERFEQLLGYANDLGLYGEEIDATTGQAIGNFPQSFSHVGLITAALSLQRGQESVSGTGGGQGSSA